MVNNLKKELINTRTRLLLDKGLKDKKIVPFDEEFDNYLKHTFINGIPVYFEIKYLHPARGECGRCDDRSLQMLFAVENATLVEADTIFHKTNFGEEGSWHCWLEFNNYVYDPTLLHRVDKDLYYKIYKPTNIHKFCKEDYTDHSPNLYDNVKEVTLEDLKPEGKFRYQLLTSVPLIKGLAVLTRNETFQKEFNDYLTLINYDEKEITEELYNWQRDNISQILKKATR